MLEISLLNIWNQSNAQILKIFAHIQIRCQIKTTKNYASDFL